mmetsp:Transcript_30055/g.68402  ORF Transcript_30055/g.68402 Transcript_30055/m.68402 type:complete len:99 (+) Transcript_30055:40-336(+)
MTETICETAESTVPLTLQQSSTAGTPEKPGAATPGTATPDSDPEPQRRRRRVRPVPMIVNAPKPGQRYSERNPVCLYSPKGWAGSLFDYDQPQCSPRQ